MGYESLTPTLVVTLQWNFSQKCSAHRFQTSKLIDFVISVNAMPLFGIVPSSNLMHHAALRQQYFPHIMQRSSAYRCFIKYISRLIEYFHNCERIRTISDRMERMIWNKNKSQKCIVSVTMTTTAAGVRCQVQQYSVIIYCFKLWRW